MGGFARPLVEKAGDFVGDQLGKAYDKLGASSLGRGAIDLLWSMGSTFKTHPALEAVEKMTQDGVKARNDIGASLLKPIHDFQGEVKKDPKLALAHDYKTATLAQVHSSLPPSTAKTALDPLMSNLDHHTMTLPDIRTKFMAQANTYGREVAFGQDGINLAATIYPLLKGTPTDKTKAEAALGVLSMVFRDNESIKKGVEQSGIKNDVQKYMTRMQRMYQGTTGKFDMDVKAEYNKGGPTMQILEQGSHKYAMTYLAPFIAVAHMADFFKLPATVPARALWETLGSFNDQHLQQLKATSGIFFHTMHSIIDNDFQYRTGKIAQSTGRPDAGALVNKLYHNPLFHNERMLQLSIFGSAGYHSAQMWAKQAVHGNASAISALKDLNLDVNSIIQRGGELTDNELGNAIFHFTNNRLFIDKPLDRSKLAQSSPFFRIATMFHGYITREGKFLSHELIRMMKAGDLTGIAQFAGTVGIIFPACAPLLESLNTLVRTASPTQAEQKLEDDYSTLFGAKGAGPAAMEYLNLLAHFGGAGVFMNYIHAAANHKMAAAMLGPTPSVATGIVEDLATPIVRPNKTTGQGNWHPLERDFLRYATIPIIGNWASEHLVPKGRQNSGSSISTHSRFRRRGRRH